MRSLRIRLTRSWACDRFAARAGQAHNSESQISGGHFSRSILAGGVQSARIRVGRQIRAGKPFAPVPRGHEKSGV